MGKDKFNKVMEELFQVMPSGYSKPTLFWRLGIDGEYLSYSRGDYEMREKKANEFLKMSEFTVSDFVYFQKNKVYKNRVSGADIQSIARSCGLTIVALDEGLRLYLFDKDFPDGRLALNRIFSSNNYRDLFEVCYILKRKAIKTKNIKSKNKFYLMAYKLLVNNVGSEQASKLSLGRIQDIKQGI